MGKLGSIPLASTTRLYYGIFNVDYTKLKESKLNEEGRALLKVLKNRVIIEIQVTKTSEGPSTINQGKGGSELGDANSNTTNKEYSETTEIISNEGGYVTKNAEEAIYKGNKYKVGENDISISPTIAGDNWVYFDNKNKNTVSSEPGDLPANTNGIIVVNGNKRNPSDISKILTKALLSIKLPEIR